MKTFSDFTASGYVGFVFRVIKSHKEMGCTHDLGNKFTSFWICSLHVYSSPSQKSNLKVEFMSLTPLIFSFLLPATLGQVNQRASLSYLSTTKLSASPSQSPFEYHPYLSTYLSKKNALIPLSIFFFMTLLSFKRYRHQHTKRLS